MLLLSPLSKPLFHCQALQDGVIVDVLHRFTSVAPHLRLALQQESYSREYGETTSDLTNLVSNHKDVISRKAAFVARHFVKHACKEPSSRGMLVRHMNTALQEFCIHADACSSHTLLQVCSSRAAVVEYFKALCEKVPFAVEEEMKAGTTDGNLESQRFTLYAAFSGTVNEMSEVGSAWLAL